MSLRTSLRAALVAAITVAPLAVDAQQLSDRFTVHGFLTQGYGVSDSLGVLGIPADGGTGDYRAAALQLRYALSGRESLVLQLAHNRMGQSPIAAGSANVALDWAFYQRRFDTGTSLRVGRVPMPRGILNEVRDVGTVLPFFRAPHQFYTDTYENVDGAVVAQNVSLGRWGLETSVYGGGFEIAYADATQGVVHQRGEKMVGTQLWLSTPIDGVRIGAGALRYSFPTDTALAAIPGASQSGTDVRASLDVVRNRFVVRAEAARATYIGLLDHTTGYVQGGVRVGERVMLNAQSEFADFGGSIPTPYGDVSFDQELARDHAIGANVTLGANLILKVEGHRAKGFFFDKPLAQGAPAGRTNYVISSLAVSF